MSHLQDTLNVLFELNRARSIGQHGAAELLAEQLEVLDEKVGYVRSPAPPEPPLQHDQFLAWRRKWDTKGNPIVPGVAPRAPRGARYVDLTIEKGGGP